MISQKFKFKTKINAKKFASSSWVAASIRLGYFSRGIFYSLIGVFAFTLALGIEKSSANQQDIFLFIRHIFYGYWILIIFLIGLAGYSLWGFIRAVKDYLFPQQKPIPLLERLGYLFSGLFYASLLFPVFEILINQPENGAHKDSLRNVSIILLHIPFGQLFLFVIGVTSFFSGCYQIRRALLVKKSSDVNYNKSIAPDHILILISRIGIAARGLIWTMIGIFAMIASIYADSSRIKDTNEVFESLKNLPFGSLIVMILAGGFMLFGIYSMTLSIWGKLPNNEKN
ncbi:MAG: DUF1206 domain-containing protein [Candidatus Levyibacteriota bacterium]